MKLAFIAGLSDKKLRQKLEPILILDEVDKIDLYRRKAYKDAKLHWKYVPRGLINRPLLGDIWRFITLLMNGYKYDLIIGCHQKYHGVYACITGFVWRKPVIQMIISEVDRVWKNPVFRMSVVSAVACAVRGNISMKRLAELGYKKQITVICNPFEIPGSEQTEINKEYDLVCVAGLVPLKGHRWLFEELVYVKKSYPEVKLALVGTGSHENKLRKIVNEAGLDNNVIFLGWQEEAELQKTYRSSKALVLCSWHEGLPMCVIEAMSNAMPVIVTEVGELPWLVKNNMAGKLVKYGDRGKLSDAICEILSSEMLLKTLGDEAKKRILELKSDWTVEAISQQWKLLLSSQDKY